MFKRLLVSTLLLVCGYSIAYAQIPPACDPPGTTVPAENCQSACINCNFNGYMGNSGGWGPDGEPMGWCSMIQNDQWLGFIAGGTTATFTVTPSNCTGGNGLQLAVYPAGCNDNPLACNPGGAGQGNVPTTITVTGMIPGSNYYLIIDGLSADVCDFTISVLPPSAVQAPTVGPTGPITGPLTICPGASANYSIPVTTGAGFYTWSSNIPGVEFNGATGPVDLEAPGGRIVNVTFPPSATAYTAQICVIPSNSCDDGTSRCITVNVVPIPKVVRPKAIVCAEEAGNYTLPWGDGITNGPGTTQTYSNTYQSYRGCDSIVDQPVQVLGVIATTLNRTICAGSSFPICNIPYEDGGIHTETCQSFRGCDSLITLNLTVLDPIADILGPNPTSLACGQTSLTLTSAASPSTPAQSIKQWKNLATGAVSPGDNLTITTPGIYTLTTTMSRFVPGMGPGTGLVTCIAYDTVVVNGNQIPPTAVPVNGEIGCGNGAATISVTTNAITPTFTWTGPNGFNSILQSPSVNAGGTYNVTVTNVGGNGCSNTATVNVVGNTTPPTAAAVGNTITCTNTTIPITASSNIATATYSWAGPGFTGTGAAVTVGQSGVYVVTVTNPTNQCTSTASATVILDNTLPGATASVSGAISCPTPNVNLNGTSTTTGVNYSWGGPAGYAALGQNPLASVAGVYTVTVTNPTNGCASTSTITVSGNTTLPTAATTNALLSCNIQNDTIFGSSTTPGVTYLWSGTGIISSPAQPSIIVNQTGTFVLTVSAPNGCTQTANANVTGNFGTPNASATGGTLSCSSPNTTINGSSTTPGALFSWIGPGNTPYTGASVSVPTPGDYTLVVTGTNGCTQTAIATVVPDANVPNIGTIGDTITCSIANATITGSSTTPGVTFLWSGSGINPATASKPIQTVTASGLYTLVVNNPSNNCSAVASAFVTLDTNVPGVSTSNTTLTCASPTLQLFANTLAPNVTWNWTGPGFTSAVQNPIVSAPGDYFVTVTSAINGCTSTATANVAANQDIPTLNVLFSPLTCLVPTVTLEATSNLPVGFGWTGPQSFTSTAPNPSISIPGNYTVTATASNGCSSIATIAVIQDIQPPNASAIGDTITCLKPTAALTGGSNSPGVSYLWTGSGLPPAGVPLQNTTTTLSGIYNLQVTGINGCKSTVTASVEVNVEQPIIQIAVPEILTCTTLSDTFQTNLIVTQTQVSTIAWTGPTGFVSSLEDPIFTNPGVYNLTVTGTNGCSQAASIQAIQNIQPPNATAVGGTIDCNITSINLTGGSTTANSTFGWTGPNSYTANTAQPTANLGGNYLLTVTGANGCTNTATALIALDTISPGAAIASSNVLTCKDPMATLTASSNTTTGINYTWLGSGVAGEATKTVSVTTPSTYTVVIEAANGCTSQRTFIQTQDISQPNISAVGDTIDCISGVASLTGNSTTVGSTFFWTGPGTFTSNLPSPSATEPGPYSLTVTGPNGCTNSANTEIASNESQPVAQILGTGILTCDNTSVTFYGQITTPNSTGVWILPGGGTLVADSVVATVTGIYQYEVTSQANGCKFIPQINLGQNITAPASVTATAAGQLNCNNTNVTITANSSTPNVEYAWTGPGPFTSALKAPSVTAPGVYTVTVTNPLNGCTRTASVTVSANTALPNLTAETDTITCKVPSVVLDANSTTFGVSYLWSGPNNFTSTQPDPTTTNPGVYNIVVTNPANGCKSTVTLNVIQDKVAPNVSSVGALLTCAQPSAQITGASTTPGVTYQWTTPGGLILNTQNPTVNQPGNYVLQVTATNGCTASSTAVVTPDQNIPVVTVTGGIITCKEDSLQLTGAANKPNITGWNWTGPGGFVSTSQNPVVTLPGNYTLIVTTSNGCTGQSSTLVGDNTNAPVVNTNTPAELNCTTTEVNVNATVATTGNYSYEWTTTDGTILSPAMTNSITAGQGGTYTILVTDQSNGCTTTKDVVVNVDPAVPSAIAYTKKDVTCFGFSNGSIALGAITGGTTPFLFSIDNQPFIAATAFNALPPGEHVLRVQDANGCELTETFTVLEPAELLVDLGPDTLIRLGYPVSVSLANIVNDPTRVSQTIITPSGVLDSALCATCTGEFFPPYSLQYTVAIIDPNGCKAEDSRKIIVDRTRYIYVANIFQPDDSGNGNSIVTVEGGRDVASIRYFRIYDRWGASIHEANNFNVGDVSAGWDGKVKGKNADPAVFAYVVEVLFKDGEIELFTGDITLLR